MGSEDAAAEREIAVARGEGEPPLRSYIRAKQAVAEAVRDVQRLSRPYTGDSETVVTDLLARLAEDRFQLAVVGQFARGKSTLINAILGRPLLPVGALPVTSVVTSLRHGAIERAWIEREEQHFPDEIPLSELPQFITEPGNPGNRKRVLSAAIEVPASFLRRGLRFIDTPGVGSAHTRNTETTLAFLPEADAVVFVTAADAPLSEFELGFLDVVRAHVRKFFFVLNKVDQLDPAARAEMTAFVQRMLAERLGSLQPRVFPLSSSHALAARTRSDPALLAASGLPALEDALAQFLGEEHEHVLLVAVLDRALKALDRARFMVDLRRHAADRTEVRADLAQRLAKRLDALEAERRAAVQSLEDHARHWHDAVLAPALATMQAAARSALNDDVQAEARRWDLAESGRRWLDDRLAELRARAIDEHADGVRRVAADIASAAQGLIGAILHRPSEIAAEVVGTGNLSAGVQPGEETPSFAARPFEMEATAGVTPTHDASLELAALVPLPRRVARALSVRQLRRRIPQDMATTLGDVERALGDYLGAFICAIDVASAGALSAERKRIETALGVRPDESMSSFGHPAPAGDHLEIDRIHDRLISLRSALLENQDVPEEVASAPRPTPHLHADVSKELEATRAEEIDASKPATVDVSSETGTSWGRRDTCPICAEVASAVFDFLSQYQYAISADRDTRARFAAIGGLCPPHTWELEGLSSPRGLCAAYPPLLEQVGKRLLDLVGGSPMAIRERIAGLVSRSKACPVCDVRDSADERAVTRAAARLSTAGGRSTFAASGWLCLLHLQRVVARLDAATADAVIQRESTRFIEVAEAMQEYGLKFDARRRVLLSDEESRAYREGLVLLAGEKQLY
jgi:GTP-binding protein EngB required for normal cell division